MLSLSNDEIRRAIELFQNDGAVGLHDGPFLLEAAAASRRRQSGDFEAFEEAQFIELWCKDDSSSEEYSDDDYEEPKPESHSDDFDVNFDMDRPSSELSELDDFDMYQPEPDGFSDGASDGNATENEEVRSKHSSSYYRIRLISTRTRRTLMAMRLTKTLWEIQRPLKLKPRRLKPKTHRSYLAMMARMRQSTAMEMAVRHPMAINPSLRASTTICKDMSEITKKVMKGYAFDRNYELYTS